MGRRSHSADWAIAVVLAFGAVVIMWAGRQITFMADEGGGSLAACTPART